MQNFDIQGVVLTEYRNPATDLTYFFDDSGIEYEKVPEGSNLNGLGVLPWGAIITGVTSLIPNLFKKKEKSSTSTPAPSPTNLQPGPQQLVPVVIEKPAPVANDSSKMWVNLALGGAVIGAGIFFVKSLMSRSNPPAIPQYYYPPQGQLRGPESKKKPKKMSMRVK